MRTRLPAFDPTLLYQIFVGLATHRLENNRINGEKAKPSARKVQNSPVACPIKGNEEGDEPFGIIPSTDRVFTGHQRVVHQTCRRQSTRPAEQSGRRVRDDAGSGATKALALGVLRRLSGPLETRFLSLLFAGIASQETGPAQCGLGFRIGNE